MNRSGSPDGEARASQKVLSYDIVFFFLSGDERPPRPNEFVSLATLHPQRKLVNYLLR